MCGRLTLVTMDPRAVSEYLGADWDPESLARYRPRWNIGPMQRTPILREVDGRHRTLAIGQWGVKRVIGKNDDGSLKFSHPFNTVGETAFAKPQWRKALTERRCVVPSSGFYEWAGPKKDRRPIHFTRADGKLLLFAGIYDEPRDEEPLAFSVLTTTPNGMLEPIHNRMPVILERADVEEWLERGGDWLLRPAPNDVLVAAPANPAMNRIGVDGPECLEVAQSASS